MCRARRYALLRGAETAGRITTHCSAAELTWLIEAADRVCDRGDRKPELVILERISVRWSVG
jgi:hypothetical protein